MRLAPWLPALANLGALPPCASGRFDHCNHEPAQCKTHAMKLRQDGREVDWPQCPVREVIECHELRFIRTLDRDAQVAPITGYPTRFTAWVPRLLSIYRHERALADEALPKR